MAETDAEDQAVATIETEVVTVAVVVIVVHEIENHEMTDEDTSICP